MTNLEVYSEAELLQLRSEFQRVGENLYLDHAGTTLYSEKQVENASKTLKENLFCNPHTCKVTGDLVDQVRYRILQHFNTDANQYAVIFTSNATAALKLVAETFCFNPNEEEGCGSFYYCQENHTSVLGMRELVKTQTQYVLTKNELVENLKIAHNQLQFQESKLGNSLVTFSAQCNFSGYKMPLELIDIIHKYGLQNKGKQILGSEVSRHSENFFVCLDSASFVATNFLDLQKYKPDFCCISFYKIFGFPTGVGALLVSKRGKSALQKNYYGGGTVKIAMTRRNFHAKRDGFVERFEDGTLPFLSIASVLEGFRTLERLVPATPTQRTQDRISAHVFQLAKYCYHKLEELRHINGAPLIKFYNHMGYNDIRYQGGIVTFNIMHDVGTYVGFAEVACIAAVYNLILRTGCFCNPGACQWFLSLSDTDILKQYDAGHICSDYNDLVDGQPTGAVRLSFGYMTQIKDLEMAIKIIRDCYLTTSIQRLRLIENSKLPRALEHIPKRLRPQLKAICIYPIKSCGGFTVYDSWPLTRCGLQFDRNWMIVDANNMVLTQKHHARLCLIKPTIHLKDGLLELTFPEMESITVPIAIENNEYNKIGSTLCQSKVCNDLIEGVDCGLDVGKWLSKVLDVEGVRLVKQNAGRQADDGSLKDISLVNQAQLLLINKSSVWWLANKVESNQEPLQNTIDRFRANFIIETTEPFDENSYEEFQIGENTFKTDGFCTRCQMICIDQNTGQKTAEPLRTIAREFKGKIRFGIYLGMKNLRENQIVSCVDLTNVIRRSSENNL